MTRKPVLLHHQVESGAQQNFEERADVAHGGKTGRYIAIAGMSMAVAALLKARRPKLLESYNIEETRTERALQRFQDELARIPGWSLLFENHPEAIIVTHSASNRILAANNEAIAFSGFERSELINRDLALIVPGYSQVTGANVSMVWQLRKKGGAVVQILLAKTPLDLTSGPVTMWSLKLADTSDAKFHTFSALGYRLCSARTQREAIQIILDTADEFFGWDACTFDYYDAKTDRVQPVVVIDRIDGRRRDVEPVLVNSSPTPRMRKVIAEGPQLTLRKTPLQMPTDSVPMGDRTRPSASIMSVRIRAQSEVLGMLSIHSYRLDAYTLEDLALLQSLGDHCAGALERIQAEEQVQRLNQELESRIQERTHALQEAVRELEAFSYSISHDMRAPLRAMEGYTRKLLEEYPGKTLDGEGTEYLARISRSAMRLDLLIQDVLTYTNVARCDAPLSAVNVEGLLKDLIAVYPDWREPNVTIEVVSPLPEVFANEALLTQCISHLIDNALKFVAPNRSPHVRIRAEVNGAKVRTWIEDNGAGIDPKDHERIFRLFERIHPTADFYGTGVGLTIVKKALERMSGQVGFTSEPGRGSKFWFELSAPSPV